MTEALTCPYCASVDTSYKKKAEQWECNDCEKRFDAPNATNQRPQRIFLSYGHDENTSLVLELRQRLEAAGHNVWIDQTQIKVGDDWRLSIKKGLLESDRVLSFLSKHSTRDPGVCLDEIGIALAHRHGAIATLLVEPIEQVMPPPSLAHIQYLNLSNWRQERDSGEPRWTAWLDAQAAILIDIIARNAGFAGEMDELQRLLKPQTQSGRLGNLVERGFWGRDWLFDEISAWRIGQNDRTFWLVADPGMGKSAVAARLAHTTGMHTVAYHFCRFDEPGTRNPETFVCTLAFQLAARLPEYRQLLLYATRYLSKPLVEQNADDLFSLLLTSPLRSSIDGGQSEDRLMVIVDALDEAPAIADLLSRRQVDLPNWVALLLTSRPDTLIQSAMAGISPRRLSNNDPRNQEDLEIFVKQWFESSQPTPPAQAQASLLKNSQGNILYLVTAREGVRAGVFDLDKPEAYPKGLGGLYRNWFDRRFSLDTDSASWLASYALLELVCASPEPLPIALARQTLQWVGQDRVHACRPLGSLIQVEDNAIEMFHRSLAEWLQDKGLADRYWVNVQDGRIRLAQTIWGTLQEVIKAKETEYAHRVLPGLLLAIPKNRRQEIWGEGTQRFGIMEEMDTALAEFLVHKIMLSRLDLANVYAQECELHFGERSEQCLDAKSSHAKLLMEVTYDFMEAKRIIENVISIREEVLGPDHPDTATGLNELALLLSANGEFEAASPLFDRSLSIREKALGPDHPDTAAVLNNLALVLNTLGNYETARPLFERALAICEKAFGLDHPIYARGLNNLAGLLKDIGEFEAARPLYELSLTIREKVLGPEHTDTASGLENLAGLLTATGEHEAALQLFERALAIYEKAFGPDHPSTARSLNNLAVVLQSIGNYEASRPFFERSLDIWEKVLGPKHPDTGTSLNNLAVLLEATGDYEAAQPLCERSLAIREKVFGPDHPDTSDVLSNLAGLLVATGDYEAAESIYRRLMGAFEMTLGNSHPKTLTIAISLGVLLRDQMKEDESKSMLIDVLRKCESSQECNAAIYTRALSALGKLHEMQHQKNEAIQCYEKCLEIRLETLGKDHESTVLVKDRLMKLTDS